VKGFAREMRKQVDERSGDLYGKGEGLLQRMTEVYESRRLQDMALSAARDIDPPAFW
jgi:hypothetical protein